jgi:hypothetical protein
MSLCALLLAMCLQGDPKPADPKPEPPKQDPPKGFVLTSGDWSLKLYGFLRTDVFYDTQHPNNVLVPAVIKASEDDATATANPGVAAKKGSEDFEVSARLTRFGIDIMGPAVEKLGNAKVSGKLEIDFYSTNVVSDSRAEPRMRHAYVKLAWDDLFILAGQTSDIISPIFPVVNADLVMWGAGNLGDRRPQLQVDWRPKMGTGNFILTGEVGVTGADDNQNLDPAGVSFLDGVASGIPTLQGRVAYKGDHFWLAGKKFEIGAWAHYAQEKLDNQGAFTDDKFTSTGYGLDLVLPLFDILEIRGEVWAGKNLDDVRGGIFQGVTAVNGGTEVEAAGYWVELVLKAADWYTLHVGTSHDNPHNDDILDTASASPITGADQNHIIYVANRFAPGGGLTIGLDVLFWNTHWVAGFEDGEDVRVNFIVQWNFRTD